MSLKRTYLIGVLCASVALTACSNFSNTHVEYETAKPDEFPVLVAVGYAPIANQPGKNKQQKMLNAMRASKIDAYRELAEQLHGLQLTSGSNMHEQTLSGDYIKAKVDGAIRGARVVQTYPVGEMYATELELNTKTLFYINEVQTPAQKVKDITYY
ncbi:LPP20 family lipoprotein [Motilimonas pumila]|uniref:Flagellar biosynthesis protein FlgP n=1 Tax=Motilimonas pumila TaxID=2303987 RepID=A0A418YBA6_9GAMM|nr:LPP20 family lipoprotein [Motilimonas pumila]RJG40268.1 flagellar biosynthesis protein FlgP [Motilimonas pumila]